MSNEVTKEAEEKANSSTPVVEATKKENSAETSAESGVGAIEASKPSTTSAEKNVGGSDPVTSEAGKTVDRADPTPTAAEKTGASSVPVTTPPKKPVSSPERDDATSPGEMDFGAMLAQFEQEQVVYSSGETVSGKVVRVSEQGVMIDFGYKSEGVVPLEEFTSSKGESIVSQGDEVEVVIKHMGGDRPPTLSYSDAKSRRSWDFIEQAFQDEAVITGVIKDKTKGGLKVDVNGVEAFLPGSQIDSRPVRNLDALKGKEIEAKVVKFSRKRNNIVLSRKVITDEVVNKQKVETLNRIDVGFVVEGTVKNLTEYGAFIDIGGIDGLLHVTDMSWGRLQKPGDQLKVGESVQVKVLKLDREKEKVSLGYKQLLPDPWSTVTELYPVESRIKGKVSSVTEYGAFVELEAGVEGLVHISEMSWAKRMKPPKHLVSRGDEVEVQVLGIDPDERRISLGIKQLQPNPWDTIGDRYQLGSKVRGVVRNLTDFGAFVEIEDGVDGLVHVSDISWSKKVKHPKDILKKGQEVEAVVTSIDTQGRRLSLSIKELTPSAWETFTNEHKPGDVVKGKISRFAGFGIFVELAPDLEGLCHISELSDDRIENPESEFAVSQELDFKILRIEHDVEKIGLSARAVGKKDEMVVDTKTYSSEAKGGMASLGELANLNLGGGGEKKEPEEEGVSEKAVRPEAKSEVVEVAEAKAKEEKAELVLTDETNKTAKVEVSEDKADSVKAKEVKLKETVEGAKSKGNAIKAKSGEKAKKLAGSDSPLSSEAEVTDETDSGSLPDSEQKSDNEKKPAAKSKVKKDMKAKKEVKEAVSEESSAVEKSGDSEDDLKTEESVGTDTAEALGTAKLEAGDDSENAKTKSKKADS